MMNPSTLSDSIQLAVAPVFLLTAVAGMIGALTQRLARVIDRARVIHKEMGDVSLAPYQSHEQGAVSAHQSCPPQR